MASSRPGLRHAILDAARGLVTREGYRDVSMRMIARAVGCSVSSIYLYFPNKDALIHTLIDEGFERLHEEALAVSRQAGPPIPRFEALCRRYVAFGLENPEWYEVMFLFHPVRVARYPRELFRKTRRSMDLAAQMIAECDAGRYDDEDDARLAAHVCWALLHGVVSTILAGRLDSRIDRHAYIERAIASVVEAVAPERAMVG